METFILTHFKRKKNIKGERSLYGKRKRQLWKYTMTMHSFNCILVFRSWQLIDWVFLGGSASCEGQLLENQSPESLVCLNSFPFQSGSWILWDPMTNSIVCTHTLPEIWEDEFQGHLEGFEIGDLGLTGNSPSQWQWPAEATTSHLVWEAK